MEKREKNVKESNYKRASMDGKTGGLGAYSHVLMGSVIRHLREIEINGKWMSRMSKKRERNSQQVISFESTSSSYYSQRGDELRQFF